MDTSSTGNLLSQAGSQVQRWFSTTVLTPSALVQFLVILVALGLAWLVSRFLIRPRLEPLTDLSQPWTPRKLPAYLAKRLATPFFTLFLLGIAGGLARHWGWPRDWLHIGQIFLLAWVVSRGLIITVFWLQVIRRHTLALFLALVIWLLAVLEITGYFQPTLLFLDAIAMNIGAFRLSLLHLIEGGLYLSVFLVMGRVATVYFSRWVKGFKDVSPSIKVLSEKLFAVAFYTLAIIFTLSGLGFDLTSLAWFSGAIGLGLGFGLQKVVANLAAGFIILADKSIKPGDVIQIGDTYGWINHLASRYVSVVTRDGVEYLIPNEELISGKVVNWSHTSNLVRIKIKVGVAYGSDMDLVMKLLGDAAAAAPRVLKIPPPSCRLVDLGDNSINLLIYVWISDPENGVTGVKSEVLLEVLKRFREHGIEIPFPQRVVYHQSVPELRIRSCPGGAEPAEG